MSLTATLMQPLRDKYTPQLDKNERRQSRYGAWDFFKSQSERSDGILSPSVKQKIPVSFGNTVVVPVLDARNVTISNVRSCTIADSENNSALVTLTFATYSFGFTMTPGQHFNNDVSYQYDFETKMKTWLLKVAATLDTAAVNTLNTKRNTYFPTDLTAYYANVGSALQVTDALKNDYYNNLESILETMDYYETPNVITSTSGMPLVRRLVNQGAGNDINQEFQMDPYKWWSSNRVTNGAGVKSTQFVVPDGYVACYNRNDPDAIAKSSVGNGLKQWGEEILPIVGLKWGTYYYEDCADRSALYSGVSGLTRTKVEGFEFSTDIGFITAYNSAPSTSYSPILKVELAAPAATT